MDPIDSQRFTQAIYHFLIDNILFIWKSPVKDPNSALNVRFNESAYGSALGRQVPGGPNSSYSYVT